MLKAEEMAIVFVKKLGMVDMLVKGMMKTFIVYTSVNLEGIEQFFSN